MPDPLHIARERFTQGFNCSQSVFSAFASQLGIDEETALRLASPFGGGFAHQGETCGAVTGALMALGLGRGNATPPEKYKTYQLAEEFILRFRELHGTLLCRELIGHDLSVPGELQKARKGEVFNTICPALVKDAAGIVAGMLEE